MLRGREIWTEKDLFKKMNDVEGLRVGSVEGEVG